MSSVSSGVGKLDLTLAGPIQSARRAASRSIARLRLRADVLEQPGCDLAAGSSLRPAADDAAVDPDGRPGVAVAVEQRRAVRSEVPIAGGPAHRRGVERGKERDPRLGRVARVRVIVGGRSRSRPSSRSTSTASTASSARFVAATVQPVHHLRSSRVPGPKARSQRRASSAWASWTGHPGDPVGQPALDRAPAELAPDPRPARAAAADPAVQREMEEDLLRDVDRRLASACRARGSASGRGVGRAPAARRSSPRRVRAPRPARLPPAPRAGPPGPVRCPRW